MFAACSPRKRLPRQPPRVPVTPVPSEAAHDPSILPVTPSPSEAPPSQEDSPRATRDDALALRAKLRRNLGRARSRGDAAKVRVIKDRLRVFADEFDASAAAVSVAVKFVVVSAVDPAANTVSAKFEVHAAWDDAVDADDLAARLDVANAVRCDRGAVTASAHRLVARFDCDLALGASSDLRRFPFDTVEAVAVITLAHVSLRRRGARSESLAGPRVHLRADAAICADATCDYCLSEFEPTATTLRLLQLDVVRGGVALRRRPAVYVVKVAAPTAALSVVGLAAGWLFPLDDFAGRSRLLFAVFFAQAAVARAPPPRVDGLTLLDRFLAVASAACLLAVLEAAAAKLASDFLGGDDGLLVLDAAFHALLAVAYVAANRTFLRALLCYSGR